METRVVRLPGGVDLTCHLSGDPDGTAMMLLHALGGQAASWDEVVPRFEPHFRVVTLDMRGHGASDWPGTYSFELMRDDVLGVFDELGLDDIVLVGHSMGGAAAYLVAQAQPGRIARLVLEDVRHRSLARVRCLRVRPDSWRSTGRLCPQSSRRSTIRPCAGGRT